MEDRILNTTEDNPLIRLRKVKRVLSLSHVADLRTLHEDEKHPHYLHRVQAVTPYDNFSRLNFARWYLQKTAINKTLFADVLFADETTFVCLEMFNIYNSYLWAQDKILRTIAHAYLETLCIYVWQDS